MTTRLIVLGAAMVVLLLVLITVLVLQAASKPAWDGVYRCEPGSPYTTQECP